VGLVPDAGSGRLGRWRRGGGLRAANDLGSRYVEDPPLIQAANVREKVARLAVALAARLFSTDERGETSS
jgi:hypothetical protein